MLLILSALLSPRTTRAKAYDHAPEEDVSWPIRVFAELDSFSVRYDQFFRANFDAVAVERLPTWLELEIDSLSSGEYLLARMVVVQDNDEEILKKLRELVSMKDEIGMTQFDRDPDFPSENFVLGHRSGLLTLVPYTFKGVQDTLQDMEIVDFLTKRGAFLTDQEDSEDLVVIGRGNFEEVDIWYPTLAKEVLHTHTIPGNINPTGYLEYFGGSDRDMIVTSFRFQDPIQRYLLYKNRR